MSKQDKEYIGISRRALILRFIDRLYGQDNIKKICEGDYMIIPIDRIEDWSHDLGIILGQAVLDVMKEEK